MAWSARSTARSCSGPKETSRPLRRRATPPRPRRVSAIMASVSRLSELAVRVRVRTSGSSRPWRRSRTRAPVCRRARPGRQLAAVGGAPGRGSPRGPPRAGRAEHPWSAPQARAGSAHAGRVLPTSAAADAVSERTSTRLPALPGGTATTDVVLWKPNQRVVSGARCAPPRVPCPRSPNPAPSRRPARARRRARRLGQPGGRMWGRRGACAATSGPRTRSRWRRCGAAGRWRHRARVLGVGADVVMGGSERAVRWTCRAAGGGQPDEAGRALRGAPCPEHQPGNGEHPSTMAATPPYAA